MESVRITTRLLEIGADRQNDLYGRITAGRRRRWMSAIGIGERTAQCPTGVDSGRSLGSRRMTADGVRRGKAALSSGCKAHPANSLPPEAIGAVMEVTKWLKPSISVPRIGGSASVQAAT